MHLTLKRSKWLSIMKSTKRSTFPLASLALYTIALENALFTAILFSIWGTNNNQHVVKIYTFINIIMATLVYLYSMHIKAWMFFTIVWATCYGTV